MLTLSPLAPYFAAIVIASASLLVFHIQWTGWLDHVSQTISDDLDILARVINNMEFSMFSLATSHLKKVQAEATWTTLQEDKIEAENTQNLLVGLAASVSKFTHRGALQVAGYAMMILTSLAAMLLIGPLGGTLAAVIFISFSVLVSSAIYDIIERQRISSGIASAHKARWLKKPRTRTPKTEVVKFPSYRRTLAWLTIITLAVVLGLPLLFAGTFVVLGFSSIGYYGPPIGQVMAFYAETATVLATATTPVVSVVAALLAIPRFRKFLASAFDKSQDQ